MALNWDAMRVADKRAIGIVPVGEKETDADKIEWAITEQILFSSMITGLGKKWCIGPEDVEELFDRFSAYEHVTDNPVKTFDGTNLTPRWLTLEDVRKRIGFGTNVSPVTRAAFERKLGQIAMEDAKSRRKAKR